MLKWGLQTTVHRADEAFFLMQHLQNHLLDSLFCLHFRLTREGFTVPLQLNWFLFNVIYNAGDAGDIDADPVQVRVLAETAKGY